MAITRMSLTGHARWMLTVGVLCVSVTAHAQLPGDTWSPREQARNWQAVAASADGSKLVAVVYGGRIYTSTDWGVTWVARDSPRLWLAVASSADGRHLVAVEADYVASGGYIYVSSDSGVTWMRRDGPRKWTGVASSADGTRLIAAEGNGLLYTSNDSGLTWMGRDSSRGWRAVASSADGSKLAAVDSNGQIYTSSDVGVTWTPREAPRVWVSIASSADGARLAAVVYGGEIYMSSDSGVTWAARATARNWVSIASSADGRALIAVDDGGQIHLSRDSGQTWVPRESARGWRSVATSVDGSSFVAVVAGDRVFTSGRCEGSIADRITFDCQPPDAVMDNAYAGTFGVTFANPLGGSVFARDGGGFAPSLPNVVSVRPSTATAFPFFDARDGAVEAHFATPQRAVSIDARPVSPGEFLEPLLNRPFLEAYDANHTFLGRVLYTGPLPTQAGFAVGPTETLTFVSASANISYARFSSQTSQSGIRTYGLFDNLRWFGAAPRLFNTGVNDRGQPLPTGFLQLPDFHYTILRGPAPYVPAAAAVTRANGWPIAPGAWMPNGAASIWISPHFDENCLGGLGSTESVGTFVYRTTFDTTGFNHALMSISGGVAADDGVTEVLLNGVVVATPGTGFDTFKPFTITSGFVPGINSLDFVVENGPGPACNPSGLRVEMTASVESADLALGLSDAPDPVTPGADLVYTVTVNNNGPRTASGVTMTQELPAGPTFISASSSIGSCSRSGGTLTCALGTVLSGGKAIVTVTTRPIAAGTLTTTASVSGTLADPVAGNNNASATTIVRTAGVDYVEVSVSNPPASAARGGSFSVSDTARNLGGAAAAASSVTRYYLSADTVKNAGDLQLQGTRSVAPLAAGASSAGTATVTIPSTAPAGAFYLLACADDSKVIAESNEANNCVSSTSAIQIVGPDLRVTAISEPPPTFTLSATMTVTDTTSNVGSAAAPASVTRYFLSLNRAKDAADIRLAGTRAIAALNPGLASTGQASVSATGEIPGGAYYLLACADNTSLVDELDETNNCRASQATVQVTGPDLTVSAVTAPPTAVVGKPAAVQDTTLNQGQATAAASVTRYYLSVNATKDASDIRLTGTHAVPLLTAGQSHASASVNVTIPAETAAGAYFLLACADDFAAVSETAESNNCLASAATVQVRGADLVQTAITFGSATVAAGQSFTASDTVLNQGNAAAVASVTRYYLSSDAIKSTGDRLLTGNRQVLAATAGQSRPGTATPTVPGSTPPGLYYLLACADYGDVVAETVETNNCRASTSRMTITP